MPPGAMVEYWPVLSLGDLSVLVALQHQGSFTTKAQVDVHGLVCSPGTCWYLRAVPNLPHHSLAPYERASSGGRTAGELILPLASYSTGKLQVS